MSSSEKIAGDTAPNHEAAPGTDAIQRRITLLHPLNIPTPPSGTYLTVDEINRLVRDVLDE